MRPRRFVSILVATTALFAAGCGASSGTPGRISSPVSDGATGSQGSPGDIASLAPAAWAPTEALPIEAQCRDRIALTTVDTVGRQIAIDDAALNLSVESAFPSLVEGFETNIMIFTDGKIDISCIHYPLTFAIKDPYWSGDRYGIEIEPWLEHFPDHLADATLVVVGPTTKSTDYGHFFWGAAGPEVTAIDLIQVDSESRAEVGTMTTVIANGYYVAFAANGPCCLFRLRAYDDAGTEIFTR